MAFLNRLLGVTPKFYRYSVSPPFKLATLRAMSSAASIAKLHSPLKELVAGASHEGGALLGTSEQDKAEVAEWIEKVAAGEAVKPASLQVSQPTVVLG